MPRIPRGEQAGKERWGRERGQSCTYRDTTSRLPVCRTCTHAVHWCIHKLTALPNCCAETSQKLHPPSDPPSQAPVPVGIHRPKRGDHPLPRMHTAWIVYLFPRLQPPPPYRASRDRKDRFSCKHITGRERQRVRSGRSHSGAGEAQSSCARRRGREAKLG